MNLTRIAHRSKAVQCSTDIEIPLPTPIEHDESDYESDESMNYSANDDTHDEDDADTSFEMNSEEESSDICTDVSDEGGYE